MAIISSEFRISGKKVIPLETESRTVVVLGWGIGKRGDVSQRVYKLSVIRGISSGDLRYSMVTIINNTLLHTWNLLRD